MKQSRPPVPPSEIRLARQLGAFVSWSKTTDRSARTAAARKNSPGSDDRWLREVDPEGVLPIEQRTQRARAAKSAYFTKLSLASARARRERALPKDTKW